MDVTDRIGNLHGPAAGAAAGVEPFGSSRQITPWKQPKVLIEKLLPFLRLQFGSALGKGRPFVTESVRYLFVNVLRGRRTSGWLGGDANTTISARSTAR
jgi:hypothetical protein